MDYTHTDAKPTQADENFTYATAGISAIGSIASSIANVNAFRSQLNAQTDAKIANMNNVMNSYEYTANQLEQAYDDLDSQFSDKASESLLQSMKDIATSRAIMAETGVQSGDVELGLKADEMFDLAVINSQRTSVLGGILSKQEGSRLKAINEIKTLATGGMNVNANILISGLAGATSMLGSLLVTMPNSVRAEMFGMDTIGTKGVM